MSTDITFMVDTQVPPLEVEKRVSEVWTGETQEIMLSRNPDDLVQVTLLWLFGLPDEESKIRKIIDFLFSISSDRRLYYLRDLSGFDPGDPDYPEPITVDDVFGRFPPGMHNGVQYRFEVKQDKEASNQALDTYAK